MLDFPASPIVTQQFLNWTWDGAKWTAAALGGVDVTTFYYDAKHAPGVTLDGITDCGAAFNAWIQELPPGAIIILSGDLYTSVTIVLDQARSIIAGHEGRIATAGSNHSSWSAGAMNEIIGSATVSPVVSVQQNNAVTHSNGNYMQGIGITRVNCTITNGAATLVSGVLTGLIGLQVSIFGFLADHIRVYGHDVGIALGANNTNAGIMNELRFVETWDCGTAHYFVQNVPQVTFYDCTLWGNNSAAGPQSCFWFDDSGGGGAGTANTITVSRAQMNTGGSYTTYGFRFTNINASSSVGPFYVVDTYSDGAQTAFVYVDPNCGSFIDFTVGNSHVDMPTGGVLFSDPSNKATHQHWHNNRLAINSGNILTFNGGNVIAITDNIFAGGSQVTIANIAQFRFIGNNVSQLTINACGGVCGNNVIGTLNLQGAMTGLICSDNVVSTMNYSATGTLTGMNTDLRPVGPVGGVWTWTDSSALQMLWNSGANHTQIASVSEANGTLHIGGGAPTINCDVSITPVSGTLAWLGTATTHNFGEHAFCTDCRNSGEPAGQGSGCLVYVKPPAPGGAQSTYRWCAVWSGTIAIN